MTSAALHRTPADALAQLARARDDGMLPGMLEVDRFSGDLLQPPARALFQDLPILLPSTPYDTLHALHLLPPLPTLRALERPRYFAGRELFVRTTLRDSPLQAFGSLGAYDARGKLGITHLGVLQSRQGEHFSVAVAGAPSPLEFLQSDIFAWNEARGICDEGGTFSGVRIDFAEPLWRAHVALGFMDVIAMLAELNLHDPDAVVQQERIIRRLVAHVQMRYAGLGTGYGGGRAESLLHNGQGVCFVQRMVSAAYLQHYAPWVGFDLQPIVGRTRDKQVPHGFLVATLRPSCARFVIDPAWHEPLTPLRLALFDAQWGHDREVVDFECPMLNAYPSDTDVDLP